MPETEWKEGLVAQDVSFKIKKIKKGCISFSLNCTVGVFQSDVDL